MITQKLRKKIYDRDGWQCVACGIPVDLTIQHRKNRGMGGSKSLDIPENLVTMCGAHNQALEMNAEVAEIGRKNGWKLRQWDDPAVIPVRYPDGISWLLTNRFTRRKK